jgi:hypothetical protein
MSWWIWIILGFVLALAELATGGFFFVFLGASAICVGLLTGLGLLRPDWLQWLLFSVLAVTTTFFFRPKLIQHFRPHSAPGDIDELSGQTAVALEDIASLGAGKVEMRGTTWTARNLAPGTLPKGASCQVERVAGLVLEVRPLVLSSAAPARRPIGE